jgi:protein-L-isoaspartate(D-aspartate) O-methyltransferase
MDSLTEELIRQGYLKSDRTIDAFRKVRREEFLPDEMKDFAEEDVALSIGNGQTNSQPLTVAFMLELLDPQPGQNILDVGSGSGWTTALLSHIVGRKGKVTALEVIPELSEWGKENADRFGFVREGIAEFHVADGHQGFPQNAPYDRILVSASGAEVPEKLKDQLRAGGKMVIPVGGSIWRLEKKSEGEFLEEEYPGFAFVPLVHRSRN